MIPAVNFSNWSNIDGSFDNLSICCAGQFSCSLSVIRDISNLYCDADMSCFETKISNISNTIQGRGKQALKSVSVVNFNAILLSGFKNCDENCNITNGYYLGCFGRRNCMSSTISNVQFIVASGAGTLMNSTITSTNDSDFNSVNMSVYLLSYESGSGSSITCNNNDTCTIYVWNDEIYNHIGRLSCNNCAQLAVYSLTTQQVLFTTSTNTNEPTYIPTNAPS